MRSLERRFRIEKERNPQFSTLVNFGHAVQHQRFGIRTIREHFPELVEPEDYEETDSEKIIQHMIKLSHSPKSTEDDIFAGVNEP